MGKMVQSIFRTACRSSCRSSSDNNPTSMAFRGDSGVEDVDKLGLSIVECLKVNPEIKKEERMLFATGL